MGHRSRSGRGRRPIEHKVVLPRRRFQNHQRLLRRTITPAPARPGHRRLRASSAVGRSRGDSIVLILSRIDTITLRALRRAGWDPHLQFLGEQLKATGTLPELKGKTVLLSLTPPAGQRDP